MGAGPGPAGSGARFEFPKNSFVRGLGKTSSRPGQPAPAVARGSRRVPFASPAHGGPAGSAAAPVAPAVPELSAGRRAGLPESARRVTRNPFQRRADAASRNAPCRLPPHAIRLAGGRPRCWHRRRRRSPGRSRDTRASAGGVTRKRLPRCGAQGRGGLPESAPGLGRNPRGAGSAQVGGRLPGSQAEAGHKRPAKPWEGAPGTLPAPAGPRPAKAEPRYPEAVRPQTKNHQTPPFLLLAARGPQ